MAPPLLQPNHIRGACVHQGSGTLPAAHSTLEFICAPDHVDAGRKLVHVSLLCPDIEDPNLRVRHAAAEP